MNAKELTDQIIANAKSMQHFVVERQVPQNWMPQGYVPYDIKISKGKASFDVYAQNKEQAEEMIDDYLREQSEHE